MADEAAAVEPAETDVDKLVAEFETGGKKDYSLVKPLVDVIKPLASYVQQQRVRDENAEVAKSIDAAVSTIKSVDNLKDVSNKLVSGYLQGRASEDAEFAAAYQNRNKNPAAWQEHLVKARVDFMEDIKSINERNLRSDVEAAAAAVRGAGSAGEVKQEVAVEDLFAMSDTEFRAHKNKLMH